MHVVFAWTTGVVVGMQCMNLIKPNVMPGWRLKSRNDSASNMQNGRLKKIGGIRVHRISMIEPVPHSWPVHKLGYEFMVLSLGKHSSFVDLERLHWCAEMFGPMDQGAYMDQGSWMCFQNLSHAQLYDMTWSTVGVGSPLS
jgi:hypothetical protein